MSIFKNPEWNYLDTRVYLGTYHPYRVWGADGDKVKNPLFDAYSGLMLDVKENDAAAIEQIRRRLDAILAENIAVACVPSHDPAKLESGIRNLSRRIAATNRIDATGCLVRTKKIAKLADGGDRSVEVHLGSIQVANPQVIHGREVLLLDDITTSGNSLIACQQLLMQAGAGAVQRMALALTSKD